MAVKKMALESFLKPSSHYSDNQKNLRSIFIDKNEDDLKPDPKSSFDTVSLFGAPLNGTQLEHIKNTTGTQPSPVIQFESNQALHNEPSGTQQEHIRSTIGTQAFQAGNNLDSALEISTADTDINSPDSIMLDNSIGTHKEHVKNTNGTHDEAHQLKHATNQELLTIDPISASSGTQLEHIRSTKGAQNHLCTTKPEVSRPKTSTSLATQSSTSLEPSLSKSPSNRNFSGTHQEHIGNTNRTHNNNIRNTSRTQLRHNSGTIATQQEHAKEHRIEHNRNTIGTQQEHNSSPQYGLSYLTGIQKQLLIFFYHSCKKTRSHTTEEFSLVNVANALHIKLGSVKTSLRRLEEKGFTYGVRFKKGRGGWTKFELPDAIYRELLEHEKQHNWNTTGTQQEHISDTQRNTQKDTTASSSRSNINNILTTTELADEWQFDITSYRAFGFTHTQLKQLAQLPNVLASNIEQSLIEFYYDHENNSLPNNIKTGKLNYLMGILRNSGSYTSTAYMDEQQKTLAEMARRAGDKQRKLMEDKFLVWEANLTDEQRANITDKLPPRLMVLEKASGTSALEVKQFYFEYFINSKMKDVISL